MQVQARNRSTFELAWALWRRRKWLAIVMFAMAYSAALSLVSALPDLYRATATVLVKQDQVPESFIRSSVAGETETRLHAISQQILSRSRLQDLIARFDLYPELRKRAFPEVVIARMRRDVQLEFKGVEQKWGRTATIAFNLSYQGWDPQTVAQVTNTLVSFYVAENETIRERLAARTSEFLKDRLGEVEKKQRDQERRVAEFKARYVGELPEQEKVNLASLERVNKELQLNSENQIRAMEHREKVLRELGEADGGDPKGNPGETAVRLRQLKRELAELRTRFTDKYPDVVRLKREIAALERLQRLPRKLDDGTRGPRGQASPPRGGLREYLGEVENRLEALKKEETRLREALNMYQRRLDNIPKRELALQDLKGDHETAKRELYGSLLGRYEEAQLAERMVRQKGEEIQILDRAVPPKMPVKPNRFRLILMSLVLSLGIAAVAMFLSEMADTSFHGVEELGGFTQVPVLAVIPGIVTKGDIWRRRLRFCAVTISVVLWLAVVVRVFYLLGDGNRQLVLMLA